MATSRIVDGARGVRIDSHAYSGYSVPPYYDSMIAKVIAMGTTRDHAIDRMRRALGEYIIRGIKTTIPLHLKILADADFAAGNINTAFLDRFNPVKPARLAEAV